MPLNCYTTTEFGRKEQKLIDKKREKGFGIFDTKPESWKSYSQKVVYKDDSDFIGVSKDFQSRTSFLAISNTRKEGVTITTPADGKGASGWD